MKNNNNNMKPRKIKSFNLLILKTLYLKEVKRFISIIGQTVVAPVISILLFLAIFHLSIGKYKVNIGNIPFQQFIVPGLIIMNMIQNAFSGASTSIVSGKMTGSIIDFMMPPISNSEKIIALMGAGITRGLILGIFSTIIIKFFVPIEIWSITWLFIYAILGTSLLALIGIMTGIWAEKWENVSLITTFIITPLAFLSGTFYSIKNLPKSIQNITEYNPIFFIIDGFRYAMTGYSDSNYQKNAIILIIIIIALFFVAKKMLDSGYKLKN